MLYKSKLNSNGKCPIKCRVTYKKERKEFSTGFLISPQAWKSKKQLVTEKEENYDFINTQLGIINQEINQAYLFLQVNKDSFGVSDIVKKFKGEVDSKEIGVMQSYWLFCKYLKKLIDKELNKETYDKYVVYGSHLQDFIKWKFKSNDIQLESIKSSFLTQYEYYLKTEKNFQQSSLNKVIQRFRRSIRYSVSEDYLKKDPFMLYKAKTVKKEIFYLSKEQLSTLEEKDFGIDRVNTIRDLFVFCCYTGLAFKEMVNLKKSQIVEEFDGELWLIIKRAKTSRTYKVPLLPQARQIMGNYENTSSEYLFKSISNANFNAYLKEIADIIGVQFNLTHHIARKTFATTVLLYNDVPMEIVSKLLGHSKMQTTQEHYGDIVQNKISEQMSRLSKKLSNKG
ncbi:MAG: site-specific integrase [Gelidibacter sp.]